jgi:hypothetical protein
MSNEEIKYFTYEICLNKNILFSIYIRVVALLNSSVLGCVVLVISCMLGNMFCVLFVGVWLDAVHFWFKIEIIYFYWYT